MGSFYGNVKSIIRSPFIFDRIYSSRYEMETKLNGGTIGENGKPTGDGIFINRYILINYAYDPEGGPYIKIPDDYVSSVDNKDPAHFVNIENYKDFYIHAGNNVYIHPEVWASNQSNNYTGYYYQSFQAPRWNENPASNGEYKISQTYQNNYQKDLENFHANYDLTVWMKIYTNNKESYICIAHLDVKGPGVELIMDAPIDGDGGAYFDSTQSSDAYYVYHMPKTWNIEVNNYNPNNETQSIIEQLELNAANYPPNFNKQHEYPYINKDGFNEIIRTRSNEENYLSFIDICSGIEYPIPKYEEIQLTKESYKKNAYYIQDFIPISEISDSFNENAEYYLKNTYQQIIFKTIPTSLNGYYTRNGFEFLECSQEDQYDANKVYYYKTGNKEIYILFDDITDSIYENSNNKNKIYVKKKNTGYVLATDNNFKQNVDYYVKSRYSLKTLSSTTYKRDAYYICNIDESGNVNFELSTGDFNENTKYYQFNDRYQYVKSYVEVNENNYQANKYYIESVDNGFKIAIEEFNVHETYYTKTTAGQGTAPREDTKRFDINLPALGNSVSDMYDFIYGSPFYLAGYTDKTSDQYLEYDGNGKRYRIESIDGIDKTLNEVQINNLSSKPEGNKIIPVYEASDYILIGYTNTTSNFGTHGVGDTNVYRIDSITGTNIVLDAAWIDDENNVKSSSTGNYIHPIYKVTAFKLIGFLKTEWNSSVSSYNGQDKHRYKINDLNGNDYSLTAQQLADNNFIHEYADNLYTIPVYSYRQDNYRPYSREELLNNINIEPYNNIQVTDPVSLAWSLYEMKKYISELRYLAAPKGGGLAGDWGLDDIGLGYIYTKPRVLWCYRTDIDQTHQDINNNTYHNIEYIYKNYKECYDINNNTYTYNNTKAKTFFGERNMNI